MKMRSKKGLAFGLVFLIGLALIATSLFLLYNYGSGLVAKHENSFYIENDISSLPYNSFFLSYLRTPYKTGNVAELISTSYINDDYNELKSVTQSILDSNFLEDIKWQIYIDDEKKVESGSKSYKDIDFETIIPSLEKGKYIDVKLVIG